MKKLLPLWIVLGVVVLGGGVFVLTQQLAGNFLSSKSKTEACKQIGATHTVTISGDKLEPTHTNAALCDKLVIINNGDKVRDMAFGVHDKHVTYDGITLKTLAKGQSLTVTLNKSGTYLFHDHHQEEVGGDFTVK